MTPRRTKRRQANATRMGRESLKRMLKGYTFDRNQKRADGTARKRLPLPEALARFLRPLGEHGTP